MDNSRTDKNTSHSYLELYELLLRNKKETAKNILEIGILQGGSIKLWHDYFANAKVYGLDVMPESQVWSEINNKERIVLHTSTDAYNIDFFNNVLADKKFDVILDDGPHTLQIMITFISLYSTILEDDGILILEDIQSWDWVKTLKNTVPSHLRKHVFVFDLRGNKGRYDDIVLVINKSWK